MPLALEELVATAIENISMLFLNLSLRKAFR